MSDFPAIEAARAALLHDGGRLTAPDLADLAALPATALGDLVELAHAVRL
ncbi:MAG: hypothetical protein JST64_07250, partial [Actinobacteria bacterium]|nr:hypothetical protein [Actinomycetota bacterium]